jgi:hypothetical protein
VRGVGVIDARAWGSRPNSAAPPDVPHPSSTTAKRRCSPVSGTEPCCVRPPARADAVLAASALIRKAGLPPLGWQREFERASRRFPIAHPCAALPTHARHSAPACAADARRRNVAVSVATEANAAALRAVQAAVPGGVCCAASRPIPTLLAAKCHNDDRERPEGAGA